MSHLELPPFSVGAVYRVAGLDLPEAVEVQLPHERAELAVCTGRAVRQPSRKRGSEKRGREVDQKRRSSSSSSSSSSSKEATKRKLAAVQQVSCGQREVRGRKEQRGELQTQREREVRSKHNNKKKWCRGSLYFGCRAAGRLYDTHDTRTRTRTPRKRQKKEEKSGAFYINTPVCGGHGA